MGVCQMELSKLDKNIHMSLCFTVHPCNPPLPYDPLRTLRLPKLRVSYINAAPSGLSLILTNFFFGQENITILHWNNETFRDESLKNQQLVNVN